MAGIEHPICFGSSASEGSIRSSDDAATELSSMQIASWRAASTEVTWRVSIDREPGRRIGARAARVPERSALVLESISRDGLIAAWNAENGTCQLREGDLLLEVNGVSGDLISMQHAFVEPGTLNILVARVVEFPTEVDVSANGLSQHGIELDSNLVIKVITPGSAAAAQNVTLPAELRVRPGDRIAAVNCRREATEIHHQLASASHLELLLNRRRPEGGLVAKEVESAVAVKSSSSSSSTMESQQDNDADEQDAGTEVSANSRESCRRGSARSGSQRQRCIAKLGLSVRCPGGTWLFGFMFRCVPGMGPGTRQASRPQHQWTSARQEVESPLLNH